jgi:hypothetical protein
MASRSRSGCSGPRSLRDCPLFRAAEKADCLFSGPVSKEQYEAALSQLSQLREGVRRYFTDNDVAVLAFPCVRVPAPLIGEDKEIEILGQ